MLLNMMSSTSVEDDELLLSHVSFLDLFAFALKMKELQPFSSGFLCVLI
jgi:hypothetical protein